MQASRSVITPLISVFISLMALSLGAAEVKAETRAATSRPAGPAIDRFESAIRAYEQKDRQAPPKPGGTLFVGSSTFAQWKTLEDDFREFHAINRGFGGSTIPEVLHYADRIVLPYKPATIVFYAGENDIAGGHSPERVLADFQTFVNKVKVLPRVRVYYISIKTAPTRMKWAAQIERANRLIREYAQETRAVEYLDTASLLNDEHGKPRQELYLEDRLHLSRAGQQAWMPVIRQALTPSGESRL